MKVENRMKRKMEILKKEKDEGKKVNLKKQRGRKAEEGRKELIGLNRKMKRR